MTKERLQEIASIFEKQAPRALDFLESEYLSNSAAIDAIATSNGYRLAGIRLKRAVFTTKPRRPDA
jgi:hypothetical protein